MRLRAGTILTILGLGLAACGRHEQTAGERARGGPCEGP